MKGDVTGEIFSLSQLIDKLDREIVRLTDAELNLKEQDAIDHALNAAFTGFHLLEWEDKERDPYSSRKARDLLKDKNSADLNLLHDVATRSKHVTISESAHGSQIDVRASVGNAHKLKNIDENGQKFWESHRQIFVKFGDERAYAVLMRVLKLFKK